MVLLYDIIKVFDLTDSDSGAMLLVVALDGGFIGVTAVNGNDLRETIAADRLFQKPQRGLCVPVLREEKVNGLAVFIHRPIQIAPLALDLNVCLVDVIVTTHKTLALVFHTQVYKLKRERSKKKPARGSLIMHFHAE